ncbi:MAG: exosortase K [Neolewinella sp.]|jgi:exosortase K
MIDASCAGFTFLCISFLMLSFVFVERFKSWWMIPLALLSALPVTVLANTSRIVTMLRLEAFGFDWVMDGPGHEFIGAFVYLFCLTGTYFGLRWWLSKPTSHNDQNSQPKNRGKPYPYHTIVGSND